MSRSRGYTRHQRARFWVRTYRMLMQWGLSADDHVRLTNAHYKNRRACSCWACVRNRKAMGPSVQERRQPQWGWEE